jgi:hypothetical protein
MLRAVTALEKDQQIMKNGHLDLLSGILVSATALFLYWQSSYVFTPLQAHLYTFQPVALHLLSLPIFTAGLVLILFNHQTLRQLSLTLALLLFLVPPPIEIMAPVLLTAFVLISLGAIFGYPLSSMRHTISEHFLGSRRMALEREAKHDSKHSSQQDRGHFREYFRIFHPAQLRLNRSDVARIVAILLIGILLLVIQFPAFAVNKITPLSISERASGSQYSTEILPAQSQYSLAYWSEDSHLEDEASKLNQDLLALFYKYTPTHNERLQEVFVGLTISSSQSSLFQSKPPPRTIQLERDQIQIDNNHGSIMQAEYVVTESTDVNSITASLNWTTSPVLLVNQTIQEEHVQIALKVFSVQTESLSQVKQQLIDLAVQINGYWLPDENLPQRTAVFLSHEGMNLGAATSICLLAILGYDAKQNEKRKRQSLTILSKLNGLNAEIVKTLQKESRPSTTDDLAEALQRAAGQPMTPEQLEPRLQELENLGVVESQVSCRNDSPVQTWKAC